MQSHNQNEDYDRNRLPTLYEVLNLRTRAPVDLWSFYIFMREQYNGVEYLDFWLDVVKHLSLCRDYARALQLHQLTPTTPESSALLENPMQEEYLDDDTDSRRLSAFLRGDGDENHPSFSRLSALIDTVDPNEKSQQQNVNYPNVPSTNIDNAASQHPSSDLGLYNTTESQAANQQYPLVSSQSDSLQPPNTSAIAAAWAQQKRRASSSPIHKAGADAQEDISNLNTTAQDYRSSSVYDDQDHLSPSDRLLESPPINGDNRSVPVNSAKYPSGDTSSPGLVTPITNRHNISSSLYSQGLAATPQMPQNAPTVTSSGSYYTSPSGTDYGATIPATSSAQKNGNYYNTRDPDDLEKQQYEQNQLLPSDSNPRNFMDHRGINGQGNPKMENADMFNQHGQLNSPEKYKNPSVFSIVSRSEIKQSAHYILVTYFIPGAEREIVLPQRITTAIRRDIEEEGRDDPEVFDEAREYVFQAMQQEAFRAFLSAKALGNTTSFGSVIRLIIGLLAAFAAFWVGFILIFLDWQPKSHRLFLIIPFSFASYGIISGLYNLDPILALLGYSETGPCQLVKVKEPYVRSLLVKRAMFVTFLVVLSAACFVIVFALVPGKRL